MIYKSLPLSPRPLEEGVIPIRIITNWVDIDTNISLMEGSPITIKDLDNKKPAPL